MTRRKTRESDMQSQAMEKFSDAFPSLKIIRINSGLAKALHGGYTIQLAPRGTPDMVVPSLNLWVEMKRPGEELNKEQLAWQAWARDHGVPHVVCDAPDDLVAHVRRMEAPSKPSPMTADRLRGLIAVGIKWAPSPDEYGYQDQFASWLNSTGLVYERERKLSEKDRVDFLVGGCIAVEFKLKCSANETLRQLARYAQSQSVEEILLVSATRTALQALPLTLNGKPVRGLCVGRSF